MEVKIKGKLVDCDYEEWSFEDKKGIKYYGVLKDENKKLVTFKIDEKDFKKYSELLGRDIAVVCNIFVKGSYSLKVIS